MAVLAKQSSSDKHWKVFFSKLKCMFASLSNKLFCSLTIPTMVSSVFDSVNNKLLIKKFSFLLLRVREE